MTTSLAVFLEDSKLQNVAEDWKASQREISQLPSKEF
jgi:hypothetical protein